MTKRINALTLLLLAGALAGEVPGRPEVEVVADLLDLFRPELAQDTPACELRRPAVAGGVRQDGLFEHPPGDVKPARVTYELDLPPASAGQLLLLAFDLALADGIKWTGIEDGVRFSLEVDGQRLFRQETREMRWQSYGVDLTALAGKHIRLGLLTEAMRNGNYDWALWGNPRLLHFRRASLAGATPDADGRFSAPITTGALAFHHTPAKPLKVRLKPDGAEKPVEWSFDNPKATNQSGWFARDFHFPNAHSVALEWEPRDALTPADLWWGAYPAQPKLVRLGATRALVNAGDRVPLRVQIKNQGRGKLAAGELQVLLQADRTALPPLPLPGLLPGETWQGEWSWQAPAKAGRILLEARVRDVAPTLSNPAANTSTANPGRQLATQVDVFPPAKSSRNVSLENEQVKLEFVRADEGFAYARCYARQNAAWAPVAVWRPLFHLVTDTRAGESGWEIRPAQARKIKGPGRAEGLDFAATARDADGVEWETRLRVILEPDRPVARLRYEWKAAKERRMRALWGPNIYAGEGGLGEAKSWGLFPGLEYLYGGEPSSNPRDFSPALADRRTPHPHKIAIPLMAVTLGPESQAPPEKPARFFTPDSLKDQSFSPPRPVVAGVSSPSGQRSPTTTANQDTTVALLWNPHQRWEGQFTMPSCRFASPNFDQGQANHRLGLFLPSTPDFVAENADRSAKGHALLPGQSLVLEASLVVAPGPAMVALREWLRDSGGLPKPHPWPRPFQAELDLCRTGFLKTVWDEKNEGWRHCIGWQGGHAPGFAALLWLDAQVAETAEARQLSRQRVDLAVTNMLRVGGPGVFVSQHACHIMQWELPFLYGYLPEALAGVEGLIQQLIKSQQSNGGWLYHPANPEQADLGQAGDAVLGTCANRAATLLRYARLTGDTAALAAGEKALYFMEQFRVPRGGQTWECPLYEPDILAAAYAIRAYHDAYRVTGNPRWLHDAVYWAETGVPFVYLWTLPDKPMMLGATIPVFGSTFYTHSWLAVPVQWCGLVYAYHVFHLAEELAHAPLVPNPSPLPLALNFSPADWRRLVELVTVSGLYQQCTDQDKIGTYPDSISRFEQRNPAFINPEDLLVNVLALQGFDPDVRTERLKRPAGEVIVSSGVRIEKLEPAGTGVRFQLNAFAGEPAHALVVGLHPREVRVNGQPLPPSAEPVRRAPGWWWEEKRQRLFLATPPGSTSVPVEIQSLRN